MYYKRIEIKNESNMPVKGDYWMSCTMGVFFYKEESLQFLNWQDFDWYLLPINEENWLREELIDFHKFDLRKAFGESDMLANNPSTLIIDEYLKTRKR